MKSFVMMVLIVLAGQIPALQQSAWRTGDARTGGTLEPKVVSTGALPQSDSVTLVPMPNWPRQVGVNPNYRPSGVTLADVNNDDTLEIIVGSTDNSLHVWNYHGDELPGWPKTLPGMVQSKAAVGDLYGDGVMVLFVTARNGYVYAFKSDGGAVPGWPQNAGGTGGFVSPTLFDLDGNDTLEVIAVQYPPGTVNVWRADGTAYPGWPKNTDYLAVATASVADVDADGVPEICVPSYRTLYLWDKDGNDEPGWPKNLGDGASYSQPELYDVDGDGKLEIGFASYPNSTPQVFMFRYDGTNQPGWPNAMLAAQPYVCPVAGGLGPDSSTLSVFSGGHLFGAPGFYGWYASGSAMPGWPVQPDFLECSPVVFGIEGGNRAVMIASNTTPGNLYAYYEDGSPVPGFPVVTPDAALPNSPSVADVDLDNHAEIALLTMDGSVSLWKIPDARYHPEETDWGTWFHDNWHTGWMHPKAPAGLAAGRGNPGVRLTWLANPEPDIKGYFVYRVELSGWFEKLTARPIPGTTYLDSTARGDTTRTYRITAVIRAGFEGRPSAAVSFNPTGVEERATLDVSRLTPNATLVRGVLHVQVDRRQNTGYRAELLDIAGRKVLDLVPGPNDIRRFAPGVYFVRLDAGTARQVEKVILMSADR
jgi:hypothetical protein